MLLPALAMFFDGAVDSPFIVPVAGCAMILGISVAGVYSGIRTREIQSVERLAAIAKGVPIPPTVEELEILHGKPAADSARKRDNIRLAGNILVIGAISLVAFFVVLAAVLQVRNVLCGAAVGLIPLGIGIALLVDARSQTRAIEEVANTAPPPQISLSGDRSL